jgi:hypothetical protein
MDKQTHQGPQEQTYDRNHLGANVKPMPSTDRLGNDFRETDERISQAW